MNYPEQGETVITAIQVRLLIRLLAMMTEDQADRFLGAIEEIAANGQGIVAIKVYRGHVRFIERTVTDDLRE